MAVHAGPVHLVLPTTAGTCFVHGATVVITLSVLRRRPWTGDRATFA